MSGPRGRRAAMSRTAAERALISTLLARPTAIRQVRKRLRPEQMVPGIRRAIYEGCLRVADRGLRLDPCEVLAAMRDVKKQCKATAEFVLSIGPELAVPNRSLPILVRRVAARRRSMRLRTSRSRQSRGT